MFRALFVSAAIAATAIGTASTAVASPDSNDAPTIPAECTYGAYQIPVNCSPAGPTPRWAQACNDVGKLAYDDTDVGTTIGTIWCDGKSWKRMGQPPFGVHTTGTSCDDPAVEPFEMSASDDDYLITCDWSE